MFRVLLLLAFLALNFFMCFENLGLEVYFVQEFFLQF